ncbi:MAG: glycosyltransferase [Gammaproteobacteria bacterium]|nr:glycosyltransferase [Gammaproteobacteria bacterium]
MTARPSIDVSVCIVTFNHAAYIARCLESVVSQLAPGRLEVLVGDDGSSDETRTIVSRYVDAYPGIIVPVFHPRRLGPSGNYRALISAARGRYIAHLDGDDYWFAGKLDAQYDVLERSDDVVGVLANALVVDLDDRPLGFFTSSRRRMIDLDYLLAGGNFLCHGSLLYRSKYRHRILQIEDDFVDYRILVRLAACGSLQYLQQPLVVYRWNSAGSMRSTMSGLVALNYWQAMLEAYSLGASQTAFRKGASRFLEKLFVACLFRRSIANVLDWVRRVHRESPVSPFRILALATLRIPLSFFRFIRRRYATGRFMYISVLYRR